MAAQAPKCQDKRMEKDKAERLAAALRENLKRRKAQARTVTSAPAKAGAQPRANARSSGTNFKKQKRPLAEPVWAPAFAGEIKGAQSLDVVNPAGLTRRGSHASHPKI